MHPKSYSDFCQFDQTLPLPWGCSILQAQRSQSSPLNCCRVLSRYRLTGCENNKGTKTLLNPPLYTETKIQVGFASNQCGIRAWAKTSENFYGDDDDTLFELAHENPRTLKKSGDLTANDTSAAAKLSWPLWLLGPCVLLSTGVIPTLWLPFVPLFEGSATAGLLALAGLDGIFNLGASMFLLMTDSCARSGRGFLKKADCRHLEIPSGYKLWTFFVNMVGLLGPLIAFIASKRGFLGLEPALLPMSAMLAPYLALLLVHTFAELLVWQWQSPVWAILPLVYDCYSVLQLSRGLQLGKALGAPLWTVEAVKGLISWWVFVLAVQLMWIAQYVGSVQS